MIEQLPLNIVGEPSFERDDLIITSVNRTAVDFIESWPKWPSPVTILVGGVGVGKSHLARIWARRANAEQLESESLIQLSQIAQTKTSVFVEDLDRISFDETALFHLINTIRETGQTLLLTARTMPSIWRVQLPDLQSRLRAATLIELPEPNDELLIGVFHKLIADRQMHIDNSIIQYLVTHSERSLESANKLIAKLDEVALARKKPVTRKLAAEIISSFEA